MSVKLSPYKIIESIITEQGLKFDKEFRFNKNRRWRADYFMPEIKTLLEIDGAVWNGGRHVRGQGFINDCEKLNSASILGYTVLRYSTDTIQKSPQQIVKDIQFIKGRGKI